MGQTRMFRDRVVSMEQTLEGGEKHLPLLKELVREALPEFEYREHSLDHERDLFVIDLAGPGDVAKRIAWTRMVLFDAERIPTLTGDPAAALRAKIVDFIRGNAERTEILVTFRHLEEGWVDTPEPRREGGGKRRRRGGRGGRGAERGAGDRRPGGAPGSGRPPQGGPRGDRPPQGGPRGDRAPQGGPRGDRPPQGGRPPGSPGPQRGPAPQRPAQPRPPRPEGAPAAATAAGGEAGEGAKRRKRFRRRRRGGRGGGGASGSPAPAPSGGAPS